MWIVATNTIYIIEDSYSKCFR